MNETAQFQGSSKKEWLDKVKIDLKGRAIEELDWHLNDELIISPFKDQSDLSFSDTNELSSSDNSWISMEPIWLSDDLHQANSSIMRALEGGMNGLRLFLPSLLSQDQLEVLFKEVYLEMLHVDFVLDTYIDSNLQLQELDSYVAARGYSLDELSYSIEGIGGPIDHELSAKNANGKIYTINGLSYYQGISGVDQELGNIIYQVSQLIEQSVESNLTDLYHALQIKIAIDDCYLLNIAAIRALRHLIGQLFEAHGLSIAGEILVSAIFTEDSTTEDINYNRIKTSSAALSAVIAGADTIQIFNPKMDSAEPEEFRRKICRNVFHLLSMESYMDRVIDPAAGSYYIESLTDQVAQAAWTYFQHKWSA